MTAPITPASRRAKGKRLESYIKRRIQETFRIPDDDIRMAVGAEAGADIKLTKKGLEYFPFTIECKARKTMIIYPMYEQCLRHVQRTKKAGLAGEPLLVIRCDRELPLAVVDFEYFLKLIKAVNKKKEEENERQETGK